MKKLAILLIVVLASCLPAIAAPFVSLNGVAATGAGSAISVNQGAFISWQTTTTGTPTAIAVNLEGSIDGTNWFVYDSMGTSVAGWGANGVAGADLRHVVNKRANYLRCNIASYTVNNSTAKCSIEVYKD